MNLLSLLFSQPWVFVAFIVVFLLSLTLHEAAHALAATWLGDQTAFREGRLSLNPLKHVDPLGFISLLLLGFGWGRPVPFNPYQLRYGKVGPVLVAAAGPVSNIIMGVVFTFMLRWSSVTLGPDNLLTIFATAGAVLNFSLALFNLIPVPPLDGSKALLAILDEYRYPAAHRWIEMQGPNLLLVLVLFDLYLPIGPFAWVSSTSWWFIQKLLSV